MKSLVSLTGLATAALVTATLAGCATSPSPQQSRPQGSMSSTRSTGSEGKSGSTGSMNMSNSDMMAMCRDMHAQMTSAKTAQEQQAMLAEHRKHMSPEMMQHCSMMQGQQGAHPSSR